MVTLTVGIPAYRSPLALDRALNSVAAQSRLPDQVLVSDDSPGFGLEAVAREWASRLPIDYRPQKHNLGVVGNKRWILEKASGAWLAFLEHDDYWTDCNYLQLVQDAAEIGVSACLSGSYIQHGDLSPELFSPYYQRWPKGCYDMRSAFVKKLFCGCRSRIILNWSSLAVDREIALDVGAFDSRYVLTTNVAKRCYAYSQEEDMACLALLADRRPVFWTARNVAVRTIHGSNFSRATDHPGRGLENDVAFFVWLRIIPLLSSGRIRRLALYRALRLGVRRYDKTMVPALRGLPFPGALLLFGNIFSLWLFRAPLLKANRLLREKYPVTHGFIKRLLGAGEPRRIVRSW